MIAHNGRAVEAADDVEAFLRIRAVANNVAEADEVGALLLVKLMIVHQVVLNQPSEAVKSFQKMAEKMADLCRVEHKLNEGNDKAAS